MNNQIVWNQINFVRLECMCMPFIKEVRHHQSTGGEHTMYIGHVKVERYSGFTSSWNLFRYSSPEYLCIIFCICIFTIEGV